MDTGVKKIVVVGGGFAGLQLCRVLRNKKGFHVTLIDRQNHHMFQPLFYQVASARLEPSSISFPFRKIFQKAKNIDFLMANVEKIFPEKNYVQTDVGQVWYDELVIASGAYTNYFGNESVEKNAMSMKTTHEAIYIRNHILINFEEMMRNVDDQKYQNIVLVGGGPTGVELAGSFAEMKTTVLKKDYPKLNVDDLKITLVEGAPYPLNVMSDKSKKSAKRYLEELGVRVITDTFVKNYDNEVVTLSTGEEIVSRNVIWAAGVKGNFIDGIEEPAQAKGDRVLVNRMNNVAGYNNIFAVGDIAYMPTPKYPNAHPQVANVAINQAKNLGKNFLRKNNGQAPQEFEYKDLGSMATVGKHRAVVDLPFITIRGYLAWFIWMFLHLMLILSVRNKIIIFFNWAWSYFTQDTSLRLILRARQKSWG